MSDTHTSPGQLRELPAHEIREETEALVEELFKAALLMEADEELPLQISYFDLGLTSLRLTRLKQQLEELLELTIDTNVLFNEPTVEYLVLHLTDLLAGSSPADLPAQ
ncbi:MULTISPECIES: acyl carrier protein [Streptomyces]|uniref:Acyl carrier protein n=1 Tax=Streptomyces viridosporus (strain ATCC 14672 / DSM 40746 / JCM 4963 / KCTC 9882 / NRRL B-12104 / FH 1290) TaxID=566461 RepID=D6AAQ6_STRV1|nr:MULTISPECIES: acyl carrier protein [Streptomyces]EFE72591.1 acyl carrier protein [Streptomyces viridosporus ATCC 14672]PWJ04708.1 acyl carrier protein [Streptomyces sp. NWU49]